jgi:hypothetical protein
MSASDIKTFDMFGGGRRPTPGGLSVTIELRHLLSEVIRQSPCQDRYEVAARMSRFLGQTISKEQLDAFTAESRKAWRFPLEYLLAFEHACESTAITTWLAEIRGGRFYEGRDVALAELGRLQAARAELDRRITQLSQSVGDTP